MKAGYATRAARALSKSGGETIHAVEIERTSAHAISFCAVNLTPMDTEFDPDSAFSCRRCLVRIRKTADAAEPTTEGDDHA